MSRLSFQTAPEYESCGRNGYLKTSGLEVDLVGSDVLLHAVTSRGEVSEKTRIVLPVAEIDQFVTVLRSAKLVDKLFASAHEGNSLTQEDVEVLVEHDLKMVLRRHFSLFNRLMQRDFLTDQRVGVRQAAIDGAFNYANRNNQGAPRRYKEIALPELQAMDPGEKVHAVARGWLSLEAKETVYAMPAEEVLALMDEGPRFPQAPEPAADLPSP